MGCQHASECSCGGLAAEESSQVIMHAGAIALAAAKESVSGVPCFD